MGIYIKGMEMPIDGNETIIRIQSDGTVLDQYGHHLITITAVPVSPHGRVIDADALPSKDIYDQNLREYGYSQYVIDTAPTIIPAEEVYGQYTDTVGSFHWCGTHSGEHTIKIKEGEG